ncbi:uncharacterized protein (TIGR03118 family) [Plasticicumulans lactativorans]|uniref:Uncharacterized protein (TIGR03118 family) n=1 Tax=Plasticicumulans lactativorans TaxID=1133106 RepID=A0A4R2L6J9_9GAMM|nr:TIGR03118 family protein [Plasticicumulans lactativorans]TCO83028.1 uncharacterized protein (TIGR03118 family) [Plasticicumulans lactativorans]
MTAPFPTGPTLRRLALAGLLAAPALAAQAAYVETDLVSNVPGRAAQLDPDLVNPWGLSASPTSPWWVSDNGTGLSTLYNGSGVKQGLVVTIPPSPGSPPGTTSTPTGQVFNPTTDFQITPNTPARFLFATEDGTIAGWNPGTGTVAPLKIDNSASGAVYKGLALGSTGSGNLLYAANFTGGKIDVFDAAFTPTTPGGGFLDPNLPAGYVPFNIQNLGGQLYVTYALRQPGADDETAGPGLGIVDVFDTDGSLIRRLATGGTLNAPWGLALAPAGFGEFAGALLVGNFGDGLINAFDAATGAFLGQIADATGTPIAIDGLWGLAFGNGGNAGSPNELFFTAGLDDEANGLFGKLSAVSVPEPASWTLLTLGLAGLRRRTRR